MVVSGLIDSHISRSPTSLPHAWQTPREDPFLATEYAMAYITGLQGRGSVVMMVIKYGDSSSSPSSSSPSPPRPTSLSHAWQTPGEDPFLATEYAMAYITGLQGTGSRYLKAVATAKHLGLYDLEGNWGTPRTAFDAKASPKDQVRMKDEGSGLSESFAAQREGEIHDHPVEKPCCLR
jgi:hypothetical protein